MIPALTFNFGATLVIIGWNSSMFCFHLQTGFWAKMFAM
jgi:hypothetical protein